MDWITVCFLAVKERCLLVVGLQMGKQVVLQCSCYILPIFCIGSKESIPVVCRPSQVHGNINNHVVTKVYAGGDSCLAVTGKYDHTIY